MEHSADAGTARVLERSGAQSAEQETVAQAGPLTGQQPFQGLNCARACIGRELLFGPPAPVVFGLSPIGRRAITYGEGGVRLLLGVSRPVAEDSIVFGQAPCGRGRMQRRNVACLGLLPASQHGMSDIKDLYADRYGEPRVGEKVFIVTCQQKDAWEGHNQEASEIVPEKPEATQASGTATLTVLPYMHKGCTRDAQGNNTGAIPEQHAWYWRGGPELAGANPVG
jgi:hypothetical protein